LLGGLFITSLSRERRTLLNRVYIAGFQYHKGTEFRESIKVGDHLSLFAEPDNPYDHYAVAFHWNGHHIGYVPRKENKHLSRMLRQECQLLGIVTRNDLEREPWNGVKAEVFLVNT